MAFKPNYKQQRNERARSKEQKKQEKAARKATRAAEGHSGPESLDGEEASPDAIEDNGPTGDADTGRD